MDFEHLKADENMILAKHYTRGRGGHGIKHVVVHYNAGDLTVKGCYDVWQTREASAHYQVESSGRIGQLVHDRDTAWHASNFAENQRSIGIEHANRGDTITDACLESGAHLVAAVCKAYGLGRPKWMVNVFPHCHFAATSCPGPLREGTSFHNRYMARAQQWYDAMVRGTAPAAAPSTQQASTSSGGEHTGTGFGGRYRCTVPYLRVRTAPALSGGEVAHYSEGQGVTLDDWYVVADGYVWGRYTGASGRVRYIAVGRATGKAEPDDYLVRA